MDAYRFYVPDLLAQAQSSGDDCVIHLSEDQAHHARAVLRLTGGEPVVLFDGRGSWVPGIIEGERGQLSRKHPLAVRIPGGRSNIALDPPPPIALTIATAAPKGDRAEWLVEQASQLNVACVQWLDCDRAVVKPGPGKIEKWQRLAAESAKQCGRTHLMEVRPMAMLDDILRVAPGKQEKILWLEPREGARVKEALADVHAGNVLALVGPEGGWSERECDMLLQAASDRAVSRVRLTETVLRIETAVAAVAALIMAR